MADRLRSKQRFGVTVGDEVPNNVVFLRKRRRRLDRSRHYLPAEFWIVRFLYNFSDTF